MSYVYLGAFERKLRPEMERVAGPVPGLAPPAGAVLPAKTEPEAQKSDAESKVVEPKWGAVMAIPAALVLWWLVRPKRK